MFCRVTDSVRTSQVYVDKNSCDDISYRVLILSYPGISFHCFSGIFIDSFGGLGSLTTDFENVSIFV